MKPQRKRQFLPPEFVRAMLAGHSALGLAFAALIYIVCLSGTLAVFVHELGRWEQPYGPLVSELSPEAIAAAARAGYEQAKAEGGAHDMFLAGPELMPRQFVVHYHDHDSGVEGEWLADESGNLVARAETPWSEFVGELHMQLHLPRTWGFYLVGLTGVALLSSLISGLLSHPRIFKDAFSLRWGGSRRLQEADLHNRLGVWGLPFHLAVSLTGALLGLSTLIVGVLALAAYDGDSGKAFATLLGPMPGTDESAAALPDIASMIREVQRTHPDAVFSNVQLQHVGTKGQVVHLDMRSPGHLTLGNAYYFSGDGTRLGDGGLETGGVGQQILGAIQPLHFGWFGGLPVKLVYGVLGLALTIVTHSGVVIWLVRRRDKGRPAPGWEKVWAAVGWSQPLAFGTTATIALAVGAGFLVEAYLATMAAALAIAGLARDWLTASRALRLASGLALVAAVAMHMLVWGGRISDAAAWYVNLAFLASAAAIALPVLRSGPLRWRRAPQQSSQAT